MREPMSDERLAEIRERAQAATPGPWGGYGSKPFEVFQEPGSADEEGVYITYGSDREQDAEFVTGARQDVPDLLAEVERLRKALHNGRAERDRLRAERDTAAATVEKALTDVETIIAERDAAREQVKRVRTYAREGCLGSKSTIYNRVGQDLLCIVGDGTGASDA